MFGKREEEELGVVTDVGENTISGEMDEAGDFRQRIAEEMLAAGFLVIQKATWNHFLRPYLLSFDKEGLLLYCVEKEERLEQLISKGGSIEVIPEDVRIEYRDISHVGMTLKTVLGDKGIHLTIYSGNRKRKYMVASGSVSSKQVEELFATFSSIRVENKIKGDFPPTVKVPKIICNVDYLKKADGETVRRKKVSRRWRSALVVLSVLLTFTLLVLGIGYRSPLPFVVMCLWPFVITGVFIVRQKDLTLGESGFGKWTIFPAYAAHFFISVGLSWWIIIEWWECSCISRHPQFWFYAKIGIILFYVLAWWRIQEFRWEEGKKFILAFVSIAYGFQIVAMLVMLLHF